MSSIESISDAIKISAFWIGRSSDMPSEKMKWYELWIDVPVNNYDKIKEDVFALLDSLQLDHRPKTEVIIFPERLVIPVYANCTNLLDLIKQGVIIAEIRKPATPNAFF